MAVFSDHSLTGFYNLLFTEVAVHKLHQVCTQGFTLDFFIQQRVAWNALCERIARASPKSAFCSTKTFFYQESLHVLIE